jgi:hypothetical protein
MAETLQPNSRFSTEFEGVRTDSQAASPDNEGSIQLIWEQPSEDATVDMMGRFTELSAAHPNWNTVNRRSLTRASCRREASRLVTGKL